MPHNRRGPLAQSRREYNTFSTCRIYLTWLKKKNFKSEFNNVRVHCSFFTLNNNNNKKSRSFSSTRVACAFCAQLLIIQGGEGKGSASPTIEGGELCNGTNFHIFFFNYSIFSQLTTLVNLKKITPPKNLTFVFT